MQSLYELTGNYLAVLNMDDADEQTIVDTLASIKGEISEKVPNIVALIKTWESDAEIIKAEEKRLEARRKALENRAARTKQYIQECMERIKTDKIKTPLVTVSIQSNPASLHITDQDVIPAEFLVIIPQSVVPDNARIKDALKAGQEVPGAKLTQARSLRIR